MLTTIPPPLESDQETALILHPEASRLRHMSVNPPEPETAGRDLDILEALYRHWRLAVALFALIAVCGTLLVSKLVHPDYESEALIFLAPDLVQNKKGEVMQSPYRILVNQQIITILHDETLSDAIRRLAAAKVQWPIKGESDQQAIRRLREQIDVHAVPDSYEIAVVSTSKDPAKASAIANAVAESFVDGVNRLGSIGDGDNTVALSAEKEALNQQLQALLEIRGQLAKSLQVINLAEGSQIPQDEVLNQTRQALADVHYKRLEAEANLAKNNNNMRSSPADSLPQGPGSLALLQRRTELRQKIEGMLPSHPVRKQVEAELAEIDHELGVSGENSSTTVPESRRRLEAQVETFKQIEQSLSSDIYKQSNSISARAKNLAEMQLISTEILRLQNRLSQVEERSDDIKLRKVSGAVRVFAPAMPSETPKKTHKTKMLFVVWASAALLAALVPILLDHFDPHVYRSSEVEKVLEKPVIGTNLRSNPELKGFAEEQVARSVASLARLLKETPGARSIFISGLKQRCDAGLLRTIATGLSKFNISARVCSESEALDSVAPALLADPSADATLAGAGKTVVLFNGPPLLFSAEAERLVSESEILLVTIQSGLDTYADLLHCTRVLQRLKPPHVAVLVNDVRPERAGRQLRAEIKSYLAAVHNFA